MAVRADLHAEQDALGVHVHYSSAEQPKGKYAYYRDYETISIGIDNYGPLVRKRDGMWGYFGYIGLHVSHDQLKFLIHVLQAADTWLDQEKPKLADMTYVLLAEDKMSHETLPEPAIDDDEDDEDGE